MNRFQHVIALLAVVAASGCSAADTDVAAEATQAAGADTSLVVDAFVDTLQQRTFSWFWETTDPRNGLVPDRAPTPSFSSIAAVGFGLTAYPIGVERGYITREQARERTLTTLRYFWNAPQGPEPTGNIGYRGFFYHFLDMDTGLRFVPTELSTIDTALLMAGIIFCGEYFDEDHPEEAEIRALADSLYLRVEWPYFQQPGPLRMGWQPEPNEGWGPAEWLGYNEAIVLLVLALGSPTHPVGTEAWEAWAAHYPEHWGEFYGYQHLMFAPLFGHQYSHVWIDLHGIQDAFMREKGIDYFENSRRATLSQREYAIDNPMEWKDYGADVWGLTASSGPLGDSVVIDGRARGFHQYWARGAAKDDIRDDGTIVPTALGGSIPFAPDETIAALKAIRSRYGERVFREYGFIDAFNPTLDVEGVDTDHGRIEPGTGWFEDDYLGIDQGPIVAMIENHRTGLVWEYMKRSPYIVNGLCRAGFTGGWLEGRCE